MVKKPVQCLEYIVVHELVHLMERHHSERFAALMDQYLPGWRLRRDLLNKSPLAHEAWEY
ncbi:MAG: M48 family peptidase [Rhodanobacter sp.]|nr:MAG: M48 family peptidase [Rhodanobacter sp.]